MNRVAFVFPGQGSQTAGMGMGLYEACKEARAVIDIAHEAVAGEVDLRELLLRGSKEELSRTVNTQPAVLTVSIAIHAALVHIAPELRPHLVAGQSLGEYSALVAAGAIELGDAVRVVRQRGAFMQDAVPEGIGGMAAVVGLASDRVKEVCSNVSREGAGLVAAANFNSPSQTVVSGHRVALELATSRLMEAGARRVIPLPVSAPFHCELMDSVKPRLREVLRDVNIGRPVPPLVSNVDAEPVDDPERVRSLLVDQVASPVRWVQVVRTLVSSGVTDVVEMGPGKVLCKLIRGIDESITCHHVSSPSDLDRVAGVLRKAA